MAKDLRFDERVAIVTGAGGGLGRAHALLLASRGCKVVVNDLGGGMHGGGQSSSPADKVVEEIKKAGGEAVANADSVEYGDKIVQAAMDTWGRIDIVVNNAGILRDVSFHKMKDSDFDLIYRVHVLGGYKVTRAAWDYMRDASFGRVVFTASAAGIYGNFGQANYAMAKLGLVGLSNTLAIEGKKRNILVNTIAPIAGSRLTETVLPPDLIDSLKPEYVSPLVAALCHESCKDTGGLFEVGGGFFAKLRWERTQGKTFKLGRDIPPEQITSNWQVITDFDHTDHPENITESMGPVLSNLGSKSQGGNEYIDVDAALGYEFPPATTKYDERDLVIYALGVGAAKNPLDDKDLQYAYELHSGGLRAVPTFACTPVIAAILDAAKRGEQAPGLNYGFERILHGEQYTELKRPLPSSATLTHKSRIKNIWDKGKHGVVVIETNSYDESGDEVCVNEITMVVRGAGGWGGERGPGSNANAPPDRKPDQEVEQKIDDNQALLYRLSGDWNPLHADPGFAKSFGFERPILHGLCTFGYAARHVIAAFCQNDSRYFKSIRARFAETVFPGETLVTQMWKEGGKVIVVCKVKERDKVAISNCVVELYDEIPKPKAKPAAKAAGQAAPAAAPAEPTSADIFEGVRFYVEEHPDLVSQIATSFQFKLTSPDSAWLIDLKTDKGAVKAEVGASPDVTLELSESDFIGMSSGKLNPQKLYFAGKLKLSGNVMAAQKLDFLQKIDPKQVQEAMRKAGRLPEAGAAAPAADAAPPAEDLSKLLSADIFAAIRDYLEKNPDAVKQVGTIFQFKLKDPESAWLVDAKVGTVTATTGSADVTLELADADFMDMTSGAADPQKLYFSGKLKISGNVMASQKLMFLKKVDPEGAKAAIIAARKAKAGGDKPAAAAAAPKVAKAGAIFASLGKRLAKDASIAGDVGAVVQFVITDPDAKWSVDLQSNPPKVTEGAASKPTATVTLSDEDLAVLASADANAETARDLHQRGRMRVLGAIRIARKLSFLKGLA